MRSLKLALIALLLTSQAWAAASRSFDGANDEIDMGAVLDITTNDVSLCCWSKPTEDASFDHLLGKYDASPATGYNIRQADTTDIYGHVTADGTDAMVATGTDKDGVWTWVCGTYNGSTQTGILYENGVQAGTDTDTAVGSLTVAMNLQFGETGDDAFDMTGLLAYGSVWVSEILTTVQVNEYMWKPDLMEQASGYWPLWGDATEIDLSANANTGTVTGATTSGDGPPVMIGVGPV